MNVVFVGGGNASLTLMQYFRNIDYIHIAGIADINENAPGILKAKEFKIPTSTDAIDMISRKDVDIIIELTGNEGVVKKIFDHLKPYQHFMSSIAAKIMCDFIEIQNSQRMEILEKLTFEFNQLTSSLQSSGDYIDTSIHNIESVLRSMRIVTMNARIEAARAGETGNAFEVVVQAMQNTLSDIEKALNDITIASKESKSSMTELIMTENKLKESLSVT